MFQSWLASGQDTPLPGEVWLLRSLSQRVVIAIHMLPSFSSSCIITLPALGCTFILFIFPVPTKQIIERHLCGGPDLQKVYMTLILVGSLSQAQSACVLEIKVYGKL